MLTYRICIGLQRHDREVLAHGIETGIIKLLPTGEFIEVHQPLGPVDEHGHVQLNYTGTPVPKRMNQVGRAPFAHVRGFFAPVKEKPEIQRALDALEATRPSTSRPSSPTDPAHRSIRRHGPRSLAPSRAVRPGLSWPSGLSDAG